MNNNKQESIRKQIQIAQDQIIALQNEIFRLNLENEKLAYLNLPLKRGKTYKFTHIDRAYNRTVYIVMPVQISAGKLIFLDFMKQGNRLFETQVSVYDTVQDVIAALNHNWEIEPYIPTDEEFAQHVKNLKELMSHDNEE